MGNLHLVNHQVIGSWWSVRLKSPVIRNHGLPRVLINHYGTMLPATGNSVNFQAFSTVKFALIPGWRFRPAET